LQTAGLQNIIVQNIFSLFQCAHHVFLWHYSLRARYTDVSWCITSSSTP
jgi:hypothetical protein